MELETMARNTFYQPAEIEYPDRYAAAIKARIHANKRLTAMRKMQAEAPEILAWIQHNGQKYDAEGTWLGKEKHPAGTAPHFLKEAVEKWGGLTDGQLAFARKAYAERTTQNAERDAAEAARKAAIAPWTPGRQVVVGVVVSTRIQEPLEGVYGARSTMKALLVTDEGRKVWVSIPEAIRYTNIEECSEYGNYVADVKGARIQMTVTVETKADDHTFAFGSRPAKASVLAWSEKELAAQASARVAVQAAIEAKPAWTAYHEWKNMVPLFGQSRHTPEEIEAARQRAQELMSAMAEKYPESQAVSGLATIVAAAPAPKAEGTVDLATCPIAQLEEIAATLAYLKAEMPENEIIRKTEREARQILADRKAGVPLV
jgi:hypothetical protein